jgi:adenylate kinase family enzyme
VKRVAIVASASGNGKTTLGRELARRLDVPFVEVDALVHGPNWVEATDEDLRERLLPVLDADGWVVDGTYRRKLGDLVLERADTIVWLDLPLRVWLPRLLRRTVRRLRRREVLWNGNQEAWRTAFWGRESLFGFALRMHFERRRRYPVELAPFTVVRLRTPREVERWLDDYSSSAISAAARAAPSVSTGR